MNLSSNITPDYLKSKISLSCTGCWLWIGTVNGKYGTVSSGSRNFYAHRAAFQVFGRGNPDGKVICHHCDTPLCVNPDHLFAGTYRDNQHDCMAKGRWTHGEKHGRAVLTERSVREIRTFRSDGVPTTEIARRFSIHPATVRRIVSRKLWRHIP